MVKEYEEAPTIAQLVNINCKLGKTIRQLKSTLAAKDGRIEELEADLLKYGGHTKSCDSHFIDPNIAHKIGYIEVKKCDCGFAKKRREITQALKGGG